MSEIATNGPYTFEVAVGASVDKYRLLKMNAGGDVAHAGLTDDVVGICQNKVPAAAADRIRGNTCSVVGVKHNGVVRFIAAGPVALGGALQKAADGKVDDGGAGEALGYKCITSGITADGDVLEAIPFV